MSDLAATTTQVIEKASNGEITAFLITLLFLTGTGLVWLIIRIFQMREQREDERIKDLRDSMDRHESTVAESNEKKDKRIAERVLQIEERVTAICASKTEKLGEQERRLTGLAESHDRLNAYTVSQFAKHDVFRETHATDLKRLERSLESHKKESAAALEKLDDKISRMSEKIDTVKNEIIHSIAQLLKGG